LLKPLNSAAPHRAEKPFHYIVPVASMSKPFPSGDSALQQALLPHSVERRGAALPSEMPLLCKHAEAALQVLSCMLCSMITVLSPQSCPTDQHAKAVSVMPVMCNHVKAVSMVLSPSCQHVKAVPTVLPHEWIMYRETVMSL
jgi:hypothetical protein